MFHPILESYDQVELRSIYKKMMLLAKAHAFKATKSAGGLAMCASFFLDIDLTFLPKRHKTSSN